MSSESESATRGTVEYLEKLVMGVAEGTAAVAEGLAEMRVEMRNGFRDLGGKLDALTIRMGVVEKKVDRLDAKVDTLATRVDRLETKVDTLTTRVDHLNTKVDTLSNDSNQRLKRIEGHLQLKSPRDSRTPRRATRTPLTKRYKKS